MELDARLLPVAHALEAASAHPLAAAVTAYCAEKNISLSPVTDFTAPEGQGLTAKLNGETVWGGNARLAAAMGCDISALSAAAEELAAKGRTPLYFGRRRHPPGAHRRRRSSPGNQCRCHCRPAADGPFGTAAHR